MTSVVATGLAWVVAASPARAVQCAGYGEATQVAAPPALSVHESSGLATAHRRPGVLYTHNDSGSAAVVHALTIAGEVLGGHPLPKGWSGDWEAMEAGPCPGPHPNERCLYVGDIGDNRAHRERVVVRVVTEPAPDVPAGEKLDLRATWRLVYPDGPRDAEALLVHPHTGAVSILTKSFSGTSRLYRVPSDVVQDDVPVELVGSLPVSTWAEDPLVTGAAWGPDGERVAVRTYRSVLVWDVDPCGQGAWWTRPPDHTLPAPRLRQGEAMTFGLDGHLYTTSEGHPMPLFRQMCLDPAPAPSCREPSAAPAAPVDVEAPAEVEAPAPPPTTPCGCLGVGGAAGVVWLPGLVLLARRRS